MRSTVWLYLALLGTGTEKLLANPGRFGGGKYGCSLSAIGEMRDAGMILPANGALLFSGSLMVPPVMAEAGTEEKSPLKKAAGICVESEVDCWTSRKPS